MSAAVERAGIDPMSATWSRIWWASATQIERHAIVYALDLPLATMRLQWSAIPLNHRMRIIEHRHRGGV